MTDPKVVRMRRPAGDQGPSDEAIAVQLAELLVPEWRYVAAWDVWRLFTGKVWVDDEVKRVHFEGRMFLAAQAAPLKGKAQMRLLAAGKAVSIVRMASCDPQIVSRIDDWDADDESFNFDGVKVDWKEMEMDMRVRGGWERKDWGWQRQAIATDYDSKAGICQPESGDCPRWMKFLEEVTGGDTDLVDFLQRMCGYFLTGHTREQKLFFIYGPGANGKSVFVNIITKVMGAYAVTANMSMLTASNQERHPTELAGLDGARLVTIQENDEGRRLDEARVKQLTGGDRISARFMKEDFFSFVMRGKILISGNHKPALRNVDDAIKRRFIIIPFTVRIPEDSRDPELEKKLNAELPQIAAWMVKGARWWSQEGLNPPARVMAETAEYFESEDTIELWLDECSRPKPEKWHNTKELFQSWTEWCKRSGEFAGTRKQFVQRLKKRTDLVPVKNVVLGFKGRELISEPLQDARMFEH